MRATRGSTEFVDSLWGSFKTDLAVVIGMQLRHGFVGPAECLNVRDRELS